MEKPDVLIEVSSEAGRKVGGIYTVLQSKSARLVELLGDNYILIGFYDPRSRREEFAEEDPPQQVKEIFGELEKEGIKCYWGRWMTANNARLILVDATQFGDKVIDGKLRLDEIKYELWSEFQIDSLFMGWDFNENVEWSYAVGMLIESLIKLFKGKIVAHFHEWMSGAGLLYLKKRKVRVGLVFTLHATALGRSKVLAGENLMSEIAKGLAKGRVIATQEAYKFKVEGKHLMEKACALQCDVFTAVSETVAREAEYMFGKKPDLITINAIDFEKEPTVPELQRSHNIARDELIKLVCSIFLPFYPARIRDSLFIYIAGRYEFETKGIDLFIEAIGELDRRIKGRERNVFAFIFVPSSISGPRKEVVENLLAIKRIDQILNLYGKRVSGNIGAFVKEHRFEEKLEIEGTKKVAYIKLLSLDLPKERRLELVRLCKSLRGDKNPWISCFYLNYPNDRVLQKLKEVGLENKEENRVKVIFYPTYLKPGDGLLNMEYWEAISGCDVGVFPSRYESWGYTPVEAGSYLNMGITTDYAGFGRFVLRRIRDTAGRGIRVVKLTERKREEVVQEIASILYEIYNLSREELERMKVDARKIVEQCDWKVEIGKYLRAYELAMERRES